MKILVVDDDNFLRMVMVKTLQSAGYETDECADGSSAIEKLGCNTYDIVVTDIMMPRQNGVCVGAYIQKNGLRTAVLAVTSLSEHDGCSVMDFANYYVDDTLQKPFDRETFLRTVRNLSAGTNRESAMQNM